MSTTANVFVEIEKSSLFCFIKLPITSNYFKVLGNVGANFCSKFSDPHYTYKCSLSYFRVVNDQSIH